IRTMRGVLSTRRAAANQTVESNGFQRFFDMNPYRRRRSVLLLTILLATPITGFSQQNASSSAEVLTLEQAIAEALRENHSLKNAELAVGKAGDELAATRTIRLPSMHVYSLVSQQFVQHDITGANPLSSLLPGVGPFFSISVPRRPTAVF